MNRPPIPEQMKRNVRQQCFFGCVICGAPLFDYDHIKPYSDVREHTAENITLLCRNHHSDKTSGKLSLERVSESRKAPFNANRPFSSKYNLPTNKTVSVFLGSNKSSKKFANGNGVYHVLQVKDKSFLTIHAQNYWLTFSCLLTDSAGNSLLIVDKGEIVITTGAWDYTYEGTTLRVLNGPRQILLDMRLSNGLLKVNHGAFLNRNIDGFIVEDPCLIGMISGEKRFSYSGSIDKDNGLGGWVL